MKEKIVVIILIIAGILLMLTGCESSNKYEKTNKRLGDYSVYKRDTGAEICAAWYSTNITIDENTTYELLNHCPIVYTVLVDDEHIPVKTYLEENDVTIEDLSQLYLGILHINNSIHDTYDVDVYDFTIKEVWVRELDNTIYTLSENPSGQNNSLEYLDIDLQDIAVPLNELFSVNIVPIQRDMFSCTYLSSPPPIVVVLGNETIEIKVSINDTYVHIDIDDGSEEICLNNVSSPENSVMTLFNTLKEIYYEQNK